MEPINWNEILEQEDRVIANSDRKYQYHFSSLEAMSEELVYQESMTRYQEQECFDGAEDDFTEHVRDERLAKALKSLTPKQKEVIDLNLLQPQNRRVLEISKSSP